MAGQSPGRPAGAASFFAMLIYNSMIALFLVYLGLGDIGGILLWPAIALHAVIAGLLIYRGRR